MGSLICATNMVRLDEPCFSLVEMNLQSPGSAGWHRYQILHVVRHDRLSEYRVDLGPAASIKANQFRVPGGVIDEVSGRIEILHTVGELMDIADYLREGDCAPPQYEPDNLVDLYHRHQDQKRVARRKRSTFGAKVAIQRS